jgi:ubiquinone/menaquinone biosynthesis C-methylase UbiE
MSEKIYDEIYSSGHWINIGPATYTRYLLLKKITKWNKNDIVLDAGCGSGRFIKLLNPFVKEVHGIDTSERALKIAKSYKIKNAIIRNGNVLKIPYGNDFFDKVICIDVIEHIKDDKKVLKEIKRVLKKNGEAIVYFVSGELNPEIGHVHSYTIQTIQKLAKKLGLKIEKIVTHKSLIDKLINPLRKPIKKGKNERKNNYLTKLLAYLMYLECYVPLLPVQGYMAKMKKD